GIVAQRRLRADESAGEGGGDEADRAVPAGAGDPAVQEHGLADLQAVGGQGGPGIVAQVRPVTVKAAADVGAGQADRPADASADGGEPAAQEHVLADLQAVGGQGRAGIVTQVRPVTIKAAADVGAGQADRPADASADGGEPAAQEHVLADLQAVGGQGRAGIVTQVRPVTIKAAADVGA